MTPTISPSILEMVTLTFPGKIVQVANSNKFVFPDNLQVTVAMNSHNVTLNLDKNSFMASNVVLKTSNGTIIPNSLQVKNEV